MPENRYEVNFNFKKIRNAVMVYDWVTDVVMPKVFNHIIINPELNKWKERGK